MNARLQPAIAGGLAAAALLGVILWLFATIPATRPSGLLRDFNAFYCAGRAVDRGADPYRAEPIGACERERKPAPLSTGLRGLAMPAPLPPYALVPFALLAYLPYPSAALLWTVILCLAFAVTVAAMRRATGLPLVALIAAFALSDGYAALCLGQIAPLAVAAIAVAVACAQAERDTAAGFAVACAMIEPHVGLPACLGLFVWRSATRLPLLAAGLACALVAVAFFGIPLVVEYVRFVLPAHALSEAVNEKQLSLTYLLHRAGAGDARAVRLGELQYLAMVALGLGVAPLAARRFGSPGFFAALPAAFALVGGPFVHVVQMPAALPAALLLYARSRSARRPLAFAVIALAIPWMQFVNLGTIFPIAAAVVTAMLTWTLIDERPAALALTGIVVLLYVQTLTFLITTRVPDAEAHLAATYDPHALAEVSWAAYVRAVGTWNRLAYDVARLPTEAGILTIAFASLVLAVAGRAARLPQTFASGGKGSGAAERIAW